jgi:type III pantothenate kinase
MRTLVLNLGNTTLFGGVFAEGRLVRRFRFPMREIATPAAFARRVGPALRGRIDRAALASVVPALTARIRRSVTMACGVVPRLLTAETATGLTHGYRRPRELGTDRLAAALGARTLYSGKNVIVVDCGTATTLTALSAAGRVAGGAILPGYGLWGEVLAARTAQLPRVAGAPPRRALGRSPREAIASGLHFGHAGAIRELAARIAREAFGTEPVVVIGTGGNAARFARENLFADLVPDLILIGLQSFAHA